MCKFTVVLFLVKTNYMNMDSSLYSSIVNVCLASVIEIDCGSNFIFLL